MKLTKNEKKTLILLLENAKSSDSAIASKLKISSQAVGKIRKRLETSVIENYTINLNYAKLGIQTFAISLSKLTPEGLDKGELEIEQKLLDEPNIIQVHRLPNRSTTHIILFGFKDVNELDLFFHSQKKKNDLHRFIENKEIFTFSHNSLIKNDPKELFKIVINEIGTNPPNSEFSEILEIEKFKNRFDN